MCGQCCSEHADPLGRIGTEAREYRIELLGSEVFRDDFREHAAEVSREREIAALVQLLRFETGPAPVHLLSLHVAADHEQSAGVSVIGSAIAVLSRRAA